MPLPYHPKPGEALYCDYRGCIYPEMIKKRFVVVISPKFDSRDDLCTVVPISTTPPNVIEKFHHILEQHPCPSKREEGKKAWVKCDMVMTVSFLRLSSWWDEKKEGKREYQKLSVSSHDLNCIRKCVLHAVGMGALTAHMD